MTEEMKGYVMREKPGAGPSHPGFVVHRLMIAGSLCWLVFSCVQEVLQAVEHNRRVGSVIAGYVFASVSTFIGNVLPLLFLLLFFDQKLKLGEETKNLFARVHIKFTVNCKGNVGDFKVFKFRRSRGSRNNHESG